MSMASLHVRLPRIAPGMAGLRTLLLAALDGVTVGDATLTAETVELAPEGGWIVFDTEPGPLLLRLSANDPLAAADALGAGEPLVVAIEAALGLELMPTALVQRPAPDAVVIALVYGVTRAWLAVAPTLPLAPPLRADVRAEFGTLELPVVVSIAGPLLCSFEMAALAPGDLLLLSADAPVTLATAERTAHGRFTPAPPRMRVLSISDLSPETPMSIEPDTAAATPDGSTMANHPIPLMVELASITVPLSTLSGLAPGSVLSLGPAGESLPVRLTVGGRAVAIGELVAVGEGYGVLIEKRAN